MSEWISVKERLPEKTGRYQAWIPCGDSGFPSYFDWNAEMKGWNVTAESGREHEITEVTHWMPLPPPPAREEEI